MKDWNIRTIEAITDAEAFMMQEYYAEINGHEYILVTFGAFMPENTEGLTTSNLHTADARAVYARLADSINGI